MPTGGRGRSRRPKNAQPLVNMAARVPEAVRQRANQAADGLGISLSQYVQRLIERDEPLQEALPTTAGSSAA